MWVADDFDDKIYAYWMSDKARDSDNDFDTLSAAGTHLPSSIWSNRTTMWVSDQDDGKIYSYNNYQSEPPVFTSAPDGNVDENRPAGAIISTVSATDPEGFTDQPGLHHRCSQRRVLQNRPIGPCGHGYDKEQSPP